jgi:hemerythrin
MELWASGGLGSMVDFMCICVDERRIAEMFGEMFKFTHVINGWISSRQDMPCYGQLGCSGFIIISGDGNFITKKTPAFLEVGDVVFRQVEKFLIDYLQSISAKNASEGIPLCSAYPYASGCIALIDGLVSTPELNGRKCKVLKFDVKSGRFVVEMLLDDGVGADVLGENQTGKVISVRPCSLAPSTDSSPQENKKVKMANNAAEEEGGEEGDDAAVSVRLEKIDVPPSVNVDVMDDEHEACTIAINKLLSQPSVEHLKIVIDELTKHFDHEELLMNKYSDHNQETSSTPPQPFSAIGSHITDHQRILKLANSVLDKNSSTTACGNVVDRIDVEEIAKSFVRHADIYDALYGESIPQSANMREYSSKACET